jgi:hypothetical protein
MKHKLEQKAQVIAMRDQELQHIMEDNPKLVFRDYHGGVNFWEGIDFDDSVTSITS